LVVGLGTGVNAAPVHPLAQGRVVPPSECGHVNLPVRSEDDLRLMRWLESALARAGDVPHASVEEVLSGRGLAHLHAFAADRAGSAARTDSAGVLAGLAAGDPLARTAARLYTRILGQMLADQALIHLPYGGIFLIGGMARAMAPHLARLDLAAAFREPRRVPLLQRDFAISVVQDDFAALTGCAAHLAAGGAA
ncbi:MAG: glucokinase, partial [Rhodobacterales bacterium]|nr:glucokinase [Rhodobacterales bacterium]